MEKQLAQLISDFQAAVGAAVLLMSESGIQTPFGVEDWVDLDIPSEGELNNGIGYWKHGHGCRVYLLEGEVDFDFGRWGEIDGFDEWRLWLFCQNRPNIYAFDNDKALAESVSRALKKGELVSAPYNVYYVVDSVKLLDEETTRILMAGGMLPHRTRDSVHALSTQCFESADLMLEHYQVIDRIRTKDKGLSSSNRLKFRVYLLSWLGYLHTTAEGFKDLRMRLLLQNRRPASFLELIAECDGIGRLEKRHADDLRKLRNDIFHLSADDDAIGKFFSGDGERLEWARELHAAFKSFFSSYRVLSEMHFFLSGRLGESQIRIESAQRRRKKAQKAAAKLAAPPAA